MSGRYSSQSLPSSINIFLRIVLIVPIIFSVRLFDICMYVRTVFQSVPHLLMTFLRTRTVKQVEFLLTIVAGGPNGRRTMRDDNFCRGSFG